MGPVFIAIFVGVLDKVLIFNDTFGSLVSRDFYPRTTNSITIYLNENKNYYGYKTVVTVDITVDVWVINT